MSSTPAPTATHPDLVGNVISGTRLQQCAMNPNGVGNGQVDEVSHGTAMAGLIAGHGHGPAHADGILGIAPNAKILPVRTLIRAQ